jgi:peptidyl-prolyl cis-trans isomerase C
MKMLIATPLAIVVTALALGTAHAQNVAMVNGKPVPKARVEALIAQATSQGQPRTPQLEQQMRDEAVMREMLAQEAEGRKIAQTSAYKDQLEAAKQIIMIREMLRDYARKNPVTDEMMRAEYERLKSEEAGQEYRASHILVETEEEAKSLIAQIKAGAKFDELAKKSSKDPGSAEKGGDLDFASPGNYVPEFGNAMAALKKGEMTEEPVKTQYGYHIIRLDDTRQKQFPSLEEVKGQIKQHLEQMSIMRFQEEIRTKSKTDHKFGGAGG